MIAHTQPKLDPSALARQLKETRDSIPWPERLALARELAERMTAEGMSEEFLALFHVLARDPKWEVRTEMANHLLLLPEDEFREMVARMKEDCNAYVRLAADRAEQRRRQKLQAAKRKQRRIDQVKRQYAGFLKRHGAEAAAEAHKMAERLYETLVGATVHDMQNIVAPLDASLQAMRARCKTHDTESYGVFRRLTRMCRQTDALLRILEDMKAYAVSTAANRRPEALQDLVAEAHAMARAALKVDSQRLEKVRVDIEVAPRACLICNRNEIVRALGNVIKNAYEAHSPAPSMFQRGIVRIVGRSLDKDQVQLIVSDNGMGIPTEELAAVQQFTPGNTSKKATGTGFGLPIARRMVERHGGSLAIESRDEMGTQITITLPTEPTKEA